MKNSIVLLTLCTIATQCFTTTQSPQIATPPSNHTLAPKTSWGAASRSATADARIEAGRNALQAQRQALLNKSNGTK